jgi:hypothetical protein
MKKILIVAFLSTLNIMAFAFEGIIKQELLDVNSNKLSQLTWYIKGQDIKLVMTSDGYTFTFIPNLQTNTLAMFGDKPDENGDILYVEVYSNDIKTSIGALVVANQSSGNYKGETSGLVKFSQNGNNHVVEYLPSIDVDLSKFASLFKESVEVQVIASLGVKGFPISNKLIVGKGEKTVLSTKSIVKESISATQFSIPSSYKKFSAN